MKTHFFAQNRLVFNTDPGSGGAGELPEHEFVTRRINQLGAKPNLTKKEFDEAVDETAKRVLAYASDRGHNPYELQTKIQALKNKQQVESAGLDTRDDKEKVVDGAKKEFKAILRSVDASKDAIFDKQRKFAEDLADPKDEGIADYEDGWSEEDKEGNTYKNVVGFLHGLAMYDQSYANEYYKKFKNAYEHSDDGFNLNFDKELKNDAVLKIMNYDEYKEEVDSLSIDARGKAYLVGFFEGAKRKYPEKAEQFISEILGKIRGGIEVVTDGKKETKRFEANWDKDKDLFDKLPSLEQEEASLALWKRQVEDFKARALKSKQALGFDFEHGGVIEDLLKPGFIEKISTSSMAQSLLNRAEAELQKSEIRHKVSVLRDKAIKIRKEYNLDYSRYPALLEILDIRGDWGSLNSKMDSLLTDEDKKTSSGGEKNADELTAVKYEKFNAKLTDAEAQLARAAAEGKRANEMAAAGVLTGMKAATESPVGQAKAKSGSAGEKGNEKGGKGRNKGSDKGNSTPSTAPTSSAEKTAETVDPIARDWKKGHEVAIDPNKYSGELTIKPSIVLNGKVVTINLIHTRDKETGKQESLTLGKGNKFKLFSPNALGWEVNGQTYLWIDYADGGHMILANAVKKASTETGSEKEKTSAERADLSDSEREALKLQRKYKWLGRVQPNLVYILNDIDKNANSPDGVSFKLPFNNSELGFHLRRENDVYMVHYDGGKVFYNTKEQAMTHLNDGSLMLKLNKMVLAEPKSYEKYKDKMGSVSKVKEVKDEDDRIDFEMGNIAVSVRVLPFGRLQYRVKGDNVNSYGEDLRNGVAENFDALAIQLGHIKNWAKEDDHSKKETVAGKTEIIFDSLTDPYSFIRESKKIGRVISYKLDDNEHAKIRLDWGKSGEGRLSVWGYEGKYYFIVNGGEVKTGNTFAEMIDAVEALRKKEGKVEQANV